MEGRAVPCDAGLENFTHLLFSGKHHNVVASTAATVQHGILLEDILSGLRSSSLVLPTAMNDNKPDFALLDMASRYLLELNEVKDEFNVLDDKLKENILLLRDTCVNARKVASEYENKRNQFEVNIDINNQRDRYLTLDKQSENDFQIALSKYNIATRKAQEDIDLLNSHISEVKAADSESKIKDLEVYTKVQQDTAAQLEVANIIVNSVGVFHYFICFVPERVKRAHKKICELESRRTLLNTASTEDLKSHLVSYLESDRDARHDELDSLTNAAPFRDEQYRDKYIAIEARVRSDEFDYYSNINHELMLGFLKIYFIVNKLHRSLNEKGINRPDNIRHIFTRFMESFVSMAAGFYCEELGRYDFDYYLKNMDAINSHQTLNNIIVGGATADELRLVIPTYEATKSNLLMHA